MGKISLIQNGQFFFLSFRPVEFFERLVHMFWSNLGPVWLSFCLSSFLSQAVQDLLIEIKEWSKERFLDPQIFLISKQNFFDTAHLNPRLLLNFSTYYWPPALATASVAKFQLICFFVPLGRRNNVNSTLLFFCPRGRHTHCVVSKHIMISPSVVATTMAQLQYILLSLTLLATSMAQERFCEHNNYLSSNRNHSSQKRISHYFTNNKS